MKLTSLIRVAHVRKQYRNVSLQNYLIFIDSIQICLVLLFITVLFIDANKIYISYTYTTRNP
jgi:hypothetical protein